MSNLIVVNVFITAIGTDVDLELPVSSTPLDIISSLLENEELKIPKEDPETHQAIDYRIVKRGKGETEIELVQDVSLGEQGIRNKAKLSMVRDFVPG
ncbi:MAG: hypothetical protein H6581_16220 [Bacteroidia bacterium]|nr:hypothetical protein [Bacteroidia bacterium]